MKKFGLLFYGSLLVMAMNAQLKITSGATITITGGAVVFCAGDVTNDAGGIITNNGKLEVQGSFANAGTYNTTTADDSLILSGSGNVLLNGGSSTLTNLWINKTSASDEVKLSGTTLLSGKFDYTQGNFTTDPITNPSYLFSAPVTATFTFNAGKEIVGKVRRTGWTNGAARVFNQPNMLITTAGGTNPTDFTVTMIPQTAGGDPTGAEREVKRKFLFAQTGGTGFTTDVRMPYLDAELNTNTEGNLVTWQNVSSIWNGRLTPVTRDGASNYVGTTGLTTTEIANEWKLADPKYTMNATAMLRGAWTAGPTMTTLLNSGGYIPLSQPYNTAPFSYAGTESVGTIPNANIVDWVLVELRIPVSGLPADATSSTIVGRKAGFLLNNGTVVDLDGTTPISFDINKQGAGFMVVKHRNHLATMSNSLPSNAIGSYSNNFTALANVYKNPSLSDPVVLLPSSASYGMWAGDATKSNAVNSSDVTAIKAAISVITPAGYHFTDVNLSSTINSSDVTLAKQTISTIGSSSAPAKAASSLGSSSTPGKAASSQTQDKKSSVPE